MRIRRGYAYEANPSTLTHLPVAWSRCELEEQAERNRFPVREPAEEAVHIERWRDGWHLLVP